MKVKVNEAVPSMIMTLLILIILEILTTTILPAVGIENYRIPFNILIILYIGFKLESPFIAIFVVLIQLFYSIFSVEGWALGTVAGVLVCMSISYLREMLHFNSKIFTIVITELFQVVWFLIVAFLIYLRMGSMEFIFLKLERFIPESLVISLIAPFFFALFDKIWKVQPEGLLGEDG